MLPGDCGEVNMKRLDRLMKKAMGIILNKLLETSDEEKHCEVKWFPVKYMLPNVYVTLLNFTNLNLIWSLSLLRSVVRKDLNVPTIP